MKAIITRDNFKKILGLVGHIVGQTTTLPILSNILLTTDKGRIKISATNLESGLTAWVGGQIDEEGSVTLPAKIVNDYIGTTLGEKINLSTEDGVLLISTDSSSANIKTLPAEDFPLIPQIKASAQITVKAGSLRQALQETLFASASIETRPELSGVSVKVEDEKLYFVSTDGYRLSESYLEDAQFEGDFKSVIIPFKSAQEFVRLLSVAPAEEKVTIGQGENQILLELSDAKLVSRLIDGEFPDYKQLIPEKFNAQAKVLRHELVQAIRSAGLFASTTRSIKINFKPQQGNIQVLSGAGEIGDSVIDVSGEVTGENTEIVFNHKYLIDYLNTITDEKVTFEVVDANTASIISPTERKGSLYLVMPIRV